MDICVLGAGSLGSVIGGSLAVAGHRVTLVTRNDAHVGAIERRGLRLVDDEGERTIRVSASTLPPSRPVDVLIVLVKSFDTIPAIESAAAAIGADTVVLTMQNGVGCEEMIAEVIGRERVVAGRTFVGGNLIEPGVVEYGVDGRHTVIGELDGTATERIAMIRDLFESAGLATSVSQDIASMMWEKLFVNVATGAWSALTRLAYGELSVHPDVERMAIATVAEAIAVARASGVAVTTTDPSEPWRRAWHGLPAGFRASMLQSIERGGRTEVDVMHGAVVRAGHTAGVPTPINDTLLAAVRGLERHNELGRTRDWSHGAGDR